MKNNRSFFVSFILVIFFLCGCKEDNSVTDIDGNSYKTVKIGSQVWMAENLRVTHYRNGELIQNVTINSDWISLSTGAWCVYENDETYGKTYGNLYNWYAVNDPRQLAPKGWHVATDEEWTELTKYLGGESEAGGKLKEAGTTHWKSPNVGAVNKEMFSGLPGGLRGIPFSYIGGGGYWWSSTKYGPNLCWMRFLFNNDSYVQRRNFDKRAGFSVRCVRDLQ